MHVWFLYRALSNPVGNSPHMSLTQTSWRAESHAASCSDFDFWKCHIASWREPFFLLLETMNKWIYFMVPFYRAISSRYHLMIYMFGPLLSAFSRLLLPCIQELHCFAFNVRQIAIATISRRAEKHHSSVAWTMSARARNANKQQTRTSVFCPQAHQHSLCMPLLSSFSMTSDKLIAPEIIEARKLHK